MATPQLSVRQMGPTYARSLARHTRQEIAAPVQALFDQTLRTLRIRLGAQLRHVEVQRIGSRLLAAAKPLAIGPIVRGPDLEFTATLPAIEPHGIAIGRYAFAAPRHPLGAYRVKISVTTLAKISKHALERLHLRVSTTEWSDLAPALRTLARIDAIAIAARAAGVRWMWLPSAEACAFVVSFDERVPVVVSFLDGLSQPRRSLIDPIREWLDAPSSIPESLQAILARSAFDSWRREHDACA